ncbi:hypothetical protein [Sphingomonas sp. MMS24-J13]|uniref:hypothetical protein n=1 Tax=Sphingomonas sp. MMS24-J13 TaxID=3238686 RepID=UPI00384DF7AB
MADNLSDAPLAPSGAASGAEAEAPAKPNFVGTIDKLAYGRLSGWGVNMQGEPCEVTIRLNGKDVATVLSDQERGDLAAKRYSRGLGGWYVDVGPLLVRGKNIIEARFADGAALAHSPFEYDPEAAKEDFAPAPPSGPITYHGAIDTPQANVIAGWSISSDFRAASVVIQVNDREPVTIEATNDRPDLIQQQLIRSGGGWSFDVGPLLVQGFNLISVRYPDGKHLPGSPIERQNGENPPGFVKPTRPPAPAPDPVAAAPQPVPAPAPAASKPTPAQTIEVVMSPFTRKPVVADAAPALSNVTPFPDRLAARNGMPSLSELDELSLDDLSLAIAAGMINVGPAVAHEPVPDPEPTEAEIMHAELARRPGFFARLFGRG